MADDKRLDLEFAYVTWEDSCRDPHPSFRQCRRLIRHEGEHASGFGRHRLRWDNEGENNNV